MIGKILFTKSVYKSIKQQVKQEILQSAESSPQLRKEIARVFQQANRRIQNIEKSGLLSPAVSALKLQATGYTKFGMQGTWNELKIRYAQAVGFLKQPTSSASGTRQYNEHLRKAFNLSKDEFNLMSASLNNKLSSVAESDFVDKYLMRYKDFTGELETAAKDVSGQIETDAVQIQNAIDAAIDEAATKAAMEIEDTEQDAINSILDAFDNFGI